MVVENKFNILNLKEGAFRSTRGFTAVFDLLGYSEWIKQEDLSTIVAAHIDMMNMKKMIEVNAHIAFYESLLSVHSYADTFLFYTTEISDNAFVALMNACSAMFIAAIAYGKPIRGATAVGDFYASENLITGKPIIEAYENEKRQDWIGCWINDECVAAISEEAKLGHLERKQIVKYPIPFKDGLVKEVFAFNWVSLLSIPAYSAMQYLETKSFLKKRNLQDWIHERKHKNTKEFIRFIQNKTTVL